MTSDALHGLADRLEAAHDLLYPGTPEMLDNDLMEAASRLRDLAQAYADLDVIKGNGNAC